NMGVCQFASCGVAAHARTHVGGARMMQRLECLRAIYDRLEDCLAWTLVGGVACELQSLGHKPNFFYLQHAMGLGSSTGLGLALCLPQPKILGFDVEWSLSMKP